MLGGFGWVYVCVLYLNDRFAYTQKSVERSGPLYTAAELSEYVRSGFRVSQVERRAFTVGQSYNAYLFSFIATCRCCAPMCASIRCCTAIRFQICERNIAKLSKSAASAILTCSTKENKSRITRKNKKQKRRSG